MASKKEDFTLFPGEINKDTNIYEFPLLFKITDSGKMRQWRVLIRLIKESSKKVKGQNWNLFEETEVPMKKSYLTGDIPEGIVSQMWTETGLVNGKITRSAPSYPKRKNVGRSNERNYLQQALINARSKHNTKLNDGFSEGDCKPPPCDLYFPMLAKIYDSSKVEDINTENPVYIQPKLDGCRMIAFYRHDEDKVILYSRQKKTYSDSESMNNIRRSLERLLPEYTRESVPLYLDGEMYKHGVELQTISSYVRSESSNFDVEYWLYDCFYPVVNPLTGETETRGFNERITVLEEFYSRLNEDEKTFIKLTPTKQVYDKKNILKTFNRCVKKGFEGVMIRDYTGKYTTSNVRKSSYLRSSNLLKMKPIMDDEFEIVDYTEGRSGTSLGAVIWICKTKKGKTFNVTPNLPNEERYKIYKECQKDFDGKYKNRMVKVEYRSLTKDGIPSHAKAIGLRDYK
jgi:ATP-dependent DNA ligase